jgi:hypothetical protein
LLLDGLREIFVEAAGYSVKPSPVVGEWLKHHGITVATNPDLLARKTKLLRKPNGLRST